MGRHPSRRPPLEIRESSCAPLPPISPTHSREAGAARLTDKGVARYNGGWPVTLSRAGVCNPKPIYLRERSCGMHTTTGSGVLPCYDSLKSTRLQVWNLQQVVNVATKYNYHCSLRDTTKGYGRGVSPGGGSYSQPIGLAGAGGTTWLGSVGATCSRVSQPAGEPRRPGPLGRIEPGNGRPDSSRSCSASRSWALANQLSRWPSGITLPVSVVIAVSS